jgi:hypothetical protein
MGTGMNEARFMELLASFGAELSRWPEAEQEAAEGFLASAPHRTKDIWESERAFDRILALDAAAPSSLFLEAKVLSRVRLSAPRRLASVRQVLAQRTQWLAGGALAASVAVGFFVGYNPSDRITSTQMTAMEDLFGSASSEVFLTALTEE